MGKLNIINLINVLHSCWIYVDLWLHIGSMQNQHHNLHKIIEILFGQPTQLPFSPFQFVHSCESINQTLRSLFSCSFWNDSVLFITEWRCQTAHPSTVSLARPPSSRLKTSSSSLSLRWYHYWKKKKNWPWRKYSMDFLFANKTLPLLLLV